MVFAREKENLWNFRLKPEEAFFSKFKKWKAIGMPGFTHKYVAHEREKELLESSSTRKLT